MTATDYPEHPVRLRCECGRDFALSARHARRVRRGEVEPRCPVCRCENARKPLDELKTPQLIAARRPVNDDDRRWWLERMPLEELVKLAEGITLRPVSKRCLARWRRLEAQLRTGELVDVA